jgi:hypothetical protein
MQLPDMSLLVMVLHRCATCELTHQTGAANGGLAIEEWKKLTDAMLQSGSWYVGAAVTH